MEPAVPFIGLTGGMGSGKSTALAALERLGAAVLSSDAVVHELYEGEQLRAALVARWGPEVAPGGVVDRAAVAEHAFARDEDRSWLEGLLWPEAGLENLYDATIAVIGDERVRAHRAAGRGHALAEERAARQLSQQEKAKRATFVVRNDGTEEDLERELSLVLGRLGR
ncbi:MAG: dephospho-CoA kinase [Solirubrobacteraceae bacterium]